MKDLFLALSLATSVFNSLFWTAFFASCITVHKTPKGYWVIGTLFLTGNLITLSFVTGFIGGYFG